MVNKSNSTSILSNVSTYHKIKQSICLEFHKIVKHDPIRYAKLFVSLKHILEVEYSSWMWEYYGSYNSQFINLHTYVLCAGQAIFYYMSTLVRLSVGTYVCI